MIYFKYSKVCKFKGIKNGTTIEPVFELDLEMKDSSIRRDKIEMNVKFISDCSGKPKEDLVTKVTFNLEYQTKFVKAKLPKLDKLQ